MALPDLEAIDWPSYEHAYGPAADVPEMLRGMLVAERSGAAFASFMAAVNHQGWATPAAAPCMPWLIAALDQAQAPIAQLVGLLGDLAFGGSHDNWLSHRLAAKAPPELREPVRAIHPRLVQYLDHEDGAVRARAALALAAFPSGDEASAARPALRTMLGRERKAALRASALLALGIVGDETDPARMVDALQAKKVPNAVAIAARCARVWLLGHEATEEDLLALLDVAAKKKGRKAKELPWAGGDLDRLAEKVALWALGGPVPAERVLSLLEQVAPKVRERVAASFVGQAFPGTDRLAPTQWPCTVDDLTESQRMALHLAGEHDRLTRGHLGDRLKYVGLPKTTQGIRVFLGLEEGGVLDRTVTVNGEPWLVWRVLRRAAPICADLDAATLATVADQLGADAAREVVLAVLDDGARYADIVPRVARPQSLHDEGAYVQRPHAQVATVLVELMRPHAESLRALAIERLAIEAERERPKYLEVAVWLTVLSWSEPLEQRWDSLLATTAKAPPASRVPLLLSPLLASIPGSRRDAILADVPLYGWSGLTVKDGEAVVFQWQALVAGRGWWYLHGWQTPAAREALVGAIRQWSELPSVPEDVPPGTYVRPHDPFPLARCRAILAEWDAEFVREGLEPLQGDEHVDSSLVSDLLAVLE